MNNLIFNRVKAETPGKSAIDLSHEKKLSFDMGELVPIFLSEVVPGDKFTVNSEVFLRLAPMISPVMHRVNAYVHYFYVPHRLIWDGFEEHISGSDVHSYVPHMSVVGTANMFFQKGSLADYFGITPTGTNPVVAGQELSINALPFRAYWEIWNQYYRDQNLQDLNNFSKGDNLETGDMALLTGLAKRCWEKDYFTSALANPQIGEPVEIPVNVNYRNPTQILAGGVGATGAVTGNGGILQTNGQGSIVNNIDNAGITIDDLRTSNKIQEWLEAIARSGQRYYEHLRNLWGVKSSDARLHIPEYLGGGKSPIIISEVLQSVTTEDNPAGDMAGHGVSYGNKNYFSKYFEEHGYVIGILSVLPRTAYQQGIPRLFLKDSVTDWYFPQFANLGEQEVKYCELFHLWEDSTPDFASDSTFGYQSRYAEYKHIQDSVHGDFRDNLAHWTMARIFDPNGEYPGLSSPFVESDPTKRIFAVETQDDHIYAQVFNNVKTLRPMPLFGVPKL